MHQQISEMPENCAKAVAAYQPRLNLAVVSRSAPHRLPSPAMKLLQSNAMIVSPFRNAATQ
ncbi:hypothetical protein C0V72_05475 [Porphyrobacter sp. TH134]|uniref:hypothetical protein n=1 Tax=Porphyrobacter sp. TH134 TaxID=2067450 RepID=UPI000C7C0766|nr:hypothetical protein [Porphyrobacter sp. TH134]PLK24534.1 hypothetical protein C0V72_05475 [Porphyrobacter sp. TH134]